MFYVLGVRVLAGKKVVEAVEGWRESALAGREVVLDVGTGDGRYPYEMARNDPATLYVGLDPDAAAMAEYAYRASRRPARGGVENVLYVVASLEQLPAELAGIAGVVRVNFPWSGLLRGVIKPEPAALSALRRLLAPDGHLELVLTYDPTHDQAALDGETLPAFDEAYIDDVLVPAYALAGLHIGDVRMLRRDEALLIPSTWGRRLLHGRPRSVFFIAAAVVKREL